jgi:hypothetical protein
MNETEFLGALLDPRTDQEKEKDYQHDEVASASPVVWFEKKQYKYFSKRNQAYSSSCMAQSGVKMLGIENNLEEGKYIEPSAYPVYRDRANYPSGGMFHQDCLQLLCKPKACLESDLPSQNMSESQMNKDYVLTDKTKADADKYKAGGYVFIAKDMDKIASVVEQGKGVQIMLYFMGSEYWQNVPEIIDDTLKQYEDRASRHGVTIVDYTLYKGKKAFIIEDSAGNSSSINSNGQRIITERFFTERCFSAAYLLELKNKADEVAKPEHEFKKVLKFGMRNDEVKLLQDFLKNQGLFPNIPSTGNFLQITKKAVIAFQKTHRLVPDGIVGPMTNIEINKLTK